jgi:hypothetical protein
MHLDAVEFFLMLYPDPVEAHNHVYQLRDEVEVRGGDTDYSVIVWTANGYFYDYNDNSVVAQIGRWIAEHLPGIDYIYVDFKN